MDFKSDKIVEFLSQFPRDQWKSVMEATMLIAIRNISHSYPNGISYGQLIQFSEVNTPTNLYSIQKNLRRMTAAVEEMNEVQERKNFTTARMNISKRRDVRSNHKNSDYLNIVEPNTCPIEKAVRQSRTDPILKINSFEAENTIKKVENFLANPFTSRFVKE